MDIDLLSRMVGELILDHDEVGLPGLGSFVAEIVPASFSDRGYTINPPYRRLSFHPVKNEQDLLVELYASSNDVAKEAARAILTGFLAEMKEILISKKTIVFPGLGRLRATKENNFFFVCDETLDIYPGGFGLEPISLKTHQETKEEVAQVVSTLASIVSAPVEAPAAAPVAEPEAEPEAIVAPDPEPAPEAIEFIPEPEIAEAEPEIAAPESESVEPAEPAEPIEPSETAKPRRKHTFLKIVGILVAVAAVAFAAFLILARVAPDFIDSLLYTPEELRILNY